MNNILRESKFSLTQSKFFKNDKNANIYQINDEIIFEMFVNEFNDYDEMIDVLNKNDAVGDRVKNFNEYQYKITKTLSLIKKYFNKTNN